MAKFVLELVFDKDEVKRLQIRPKHREYLQLLYDRGTLIMAGPWESQTGALLIFEAADEKDMREILGRDPYDYDRADVASIAHLREWSPVFVR